MFRSMCSWLNADPILLPESPLSETLSRFVHHNASFNIKIIVTGDRVLVVYQALD